MTSLRGVTRAGQGLVSLAGSIKNEKYPALVEIFNEKQAAEYFT